MFQWYYAWSLWKQYISIFTLHRVTEGRVILKHPYYDGRKRSTTESWTSWYGELISHVMAPQKVNKCGKCRHSEQHVYLFHLHLHSVVLLQQIWMDGKSQKVITNKLAITSFADAHSKMDIICLDDVKENDTWNPAKMKNRLELAAWNACRKTAKW